MLLSACRFSNKVILKHSNVGSKATLQRLCAPNDICFRVFSTNKDDITSKDQQISKNPSPKGFTEETPKTDLEYTEWLKEHKKFDHRPNIKYRRQDYPDPISRTVGILTDDLKIFFHNSFQLMKEIRLVLKGVHPLQLEMKEKELKQQQLEEQKQKHEQQEIIAPESGGSRSSSTIFNPKLKEATTKASKLIDFSSNKKETPAEKKGSRLNILKKLRPEREIWPGHCDIVIVGGGAVGSAIAYHLKKNATDGLNIVVVEKDSSYQTSSTVLSVGGIRQQFSLPENILLSQYGMQFMRDIPRLLAVDGELPPPVNFQPHGYLTLASDRGLQQLKDNLYVQKHFNARVEYMEPSALKARFPWLSVDGVAGGVLGLENEGWFDPWSLLMGLRRKAVSLGAQYVEGEMVGATYREVEMDSFTDGHPSNSEKKLNHIEVKLADGEVRTITAAAVVLATGHNTGKICYDMLGIGKEKEGVMAYPVPIEPRKRYVYCFHAPKGPGLATPLVIDPTGAYFRREGFGNMFIGGMSPDETCEPSCDNLDVDDEYFIEKVWPVLARRVPGFEELKVQGSWAGFYEHNVFDQNGIIGTHPIIGNLIFAAGFSGHGIQHSLGVGRAIMELILCSDYKSLDLSRFQHERIHLNEPIYESGIV